MGVQKWLIRKVIWVGYMVEISISVFKNLELAIKVGKLLVFIIEIRKFEEFVDK